MNKSYLDDLHSNFILKKILNNLDKRICAQLIRYNNNIKRKANITIENYHKLYKIYSKIEVEIIPSCCPFTSENLITMNYDKSYYHIYYNDEKIEAKFSYIRNKNRKVRIVIDTEFSSFKGLFKNCRIQKLKFLSFKRIDVTDMSEMFSGCDDLIEVDLSNIITKNVTDMSYMFAKCNSLEKINISNFDTKNVTNMYHMF